ncbi:MAG: hypothetical protein LUQ37_04510 [Methanoregulaceae archaeon]|nr:hypothetical protein [Methanoregulaceae archaeon]
MNLDGDLEILEKGLNTPGTMLTRYLVAGDDLKKMCGLRRPKGKADQTHYLVWCVVVGEMNSDSSQKKYFWGHTAREAMKEAVTWKEGGGK